MTSQHHRLCHVPQSKSKSRRLAALQTCFIQVEVVTIFQSQERESERESPRIGEMTAALVAIESTVTRMVLMTRAGGKTTAVMVVVDHQNTFLTTVADGPTTTGITMITVEVMHIVLLDEIRVVTLTIIQEVGMLMATVASMLMSEIAATTAADLEETGTEVVVSGLTVEG